ncbi:MAG TPA: sulfotransferase [Xanthomonadaceae bacterium]|jgi:tetratricopeptide (TPR) repeat protein|nr:sulfotransferase [Xanthomonadaceae bacterium]
MVLPDPQDANPRSLLRAAQAAIERRDLQRADALYLEYFACARDDAPGLRDYAGFCLRGGHAGTACYLLSRTNAIHPGDAGTLVQLGYAWIGSTDFERAQEAFETALALSPADAPTHYGLGLCHEHAGAWTQAAASFAEALAAQVSGTDAFPILLNLAEARRRAGAAEQARKHLEDAGRIAPDHPALLLAKARLLREQGDAARAMILIDRCAQHAPDEPRVVLEKARCLRALGDVAHAMRWLARLEKRSPGLPETHAEYGYCLQSSSDLPMREQHWIAAIDAWVKAGDFASAEPLLDRLLAEHPTSATGWNSRGLLENARHRPDAAEAAWRKSIECDPAYLRASANLALAYESANRLADAAAVAENASRHIRERQPQDAAIEVRLVLCKLARRRKDPVSGLAHLDRIDALAPTDEQRMHASFERGKLLDMQEDAARAIAAFALGNQLALAPWLRWNPGKNKALAGVELMLDLVGKGLLGQFKPIPALANHRALAFLIGFPRSGTTLLNQVLDGHPAICAIEEKPTVQKIMDGVRNMPGGYPHALAEFDAFDVEWLRDAYFRSAAEHGAADPSRLVFDKFPMNTTLVALLHRVFPQARFVFALRHPCDVVLSCFMQSFQLNNMMANFCTLADAVAFYTRTMDLWQIYREQLPLAVHTIRYEDVVDDFDGQVRALCAFLDVPWQDDLRDFSRKALERGRITTPSYEQVSRPIYREARYRWERYREFLEPFMPALQPYIERFGYAPPAA